MKDELDFCRGIERVKKEVKRKTDCDREYKKEQVGNKESLINQRKICGSYSKDKDTKRTLQGKNSTKITITITIYNREQMQNESAK